MKTKDLVVGAEYAYNDSPTYGTPVRVTLLEVGVSAPHPYYSWKPSATGLVRVRYDGAAKKGRGEAVVRPVTLRSTWVDYEAKQAAASAARVERQDAERQRLLARAHQVYALDQALQARGAETTDTGYEYRDAQRAALLAAGFTPDPDEFSRDYLNTALGMSLSDAMDGKVSLDVVMLLVPDQT